MSAVVCGKRTLFDDFSSSPLSKRVRCGSGSPARFSHLISENRSDTRLASSGGAGCASSPLTQVQPEVFAAIRQLFPEMADSVSDLMAWVFKMFCGCCGLGSFVRDWVRSLTAGMRLETVSLSHCACARIGSMQVFLVFAGCISDERRVIHIMFILCRNII